MARLGFRIVKDVNRIPDVIKELQYIHEHVVKAGIWGDEGAEGSKLVMIASVNEFGCRITVTPKMRAYLHSIGLHLQSKTKTITIPERPFLRSTFDREERRVTSHFARHVRGILAGQLTGREALERVGRWLAGQIQRTIDTLQTPPNHPFTVARKDSSNPLVDTGEMKQAVTWDVVPRSAV